MSREIVKVQLSLYSGDLPRMILVYNKDRSIMYESPVSDEVVEQLGNQPKTYWKASFRKDGKVMLIKQIEAQGW